MTSGSRCGAKPGCPSRMPKSKICWQVSPCTVSDTVRDIVNKQGRKYTEHLLSATMEAGFDLHAIPAVLLGGGASVVSRHLSPKDGLCKTIFLLDDKVNAVGFERALAAVSRRKSEA